LFHPAYAVRRFVQPNRTVVSARFHARAKMLIRSGDLLEGMNVMRETKLNLFRLTAAAACLAMALPARAVPTATKAD
jgi:hypothetical protein